VIKRRAAYFQYLTRRFMPKSPCTPAILADFFDDQFHLGQKTGSNEMIQLKQGLICFIQMW
jgi:hypothetical protein